MRRCKHSRWLSVTARHDTSFSLQVSNRLDHLVQDLQEPESKQPRLWLFLGGKSKSTALRSICSSSTSGGPSRRHDVHLHLDARSAFSRKPVLIADGDLMPRRFGDDLSAQCHRVVKSDIPCAVTMNADDLIYSRLLCPFADVVCVFLMDYPNLDAVESRLLAWVDNGRTSSLPKVTDPHLLLVVDINNPLHHGTAVEELKSSLSARLSDLPFSSVSTVRLSPNGHVSQVSRHQVLKDTLLKFSDRVRIRRAHARYLFSAVHLSAFFSLALTHVQMSNSGPFDFIQSARLHHPVAPSLSLHLTDFLRGYSSLFEVTATGVPLIAASLLVDHYLPEIHPFMPDEVFATLYAPACLATMTTACSTFVDPHAAVLPPDLVHLIQQEFASLFAVLYSSVNCNAVELYLHLLGEMSDHWSKIHSAVTCPLCLRRTPEFLLGCGHRICKMPHCLLCREATEMGDGIGLTPDTARTRILSCDGGGSRAVISVPALILLERRINVPEIILHAFDMMIGTSSGGLVALALSVGGLSAAECLQELESLAQTAFPPWAVSPIPFISVLQRLALSYLTGSLYPAAGLEAALKSVFGIHQSLDGPSRATSSGIKVAVTTTTVPGNDPCLLTNYNGVGARVDCGYEALRAPEHPDGLTTWKAARSTTAAPGIYTEFEFEELKECFSDGATFEINPVGIALRENRAIKRRAGDHEPGEHDPAYVVSLGTGSSTHVPHHADGFWGMLLRMWSFFNSRFEGQRSWRDFVLDHPGLHAQGKLFRFDVAFDGKGPSLDHIERISEMKDLAFNQYSSSTTIDDLKLAVGVDMFYFELRCPTREDMDEIVVASRVSCRWKSPQRHYQAWLRYAQDSKIRVIVDGQSKDHLDYDQHGNLVRNVDLRIKSLEYRVSVQIQIGSEKPQHLGGSPFRVASLAKMQGLDTAFGVAERAGRKRSADYSASPNKRPRLW